MGKKTTAPGFIIVDGYDKKGKCQIGSCRICKKGRIRSSDWKSHKCKHFDERDDQKMEEYSLMKDRLLKVESLVA